MEGWGLGVGALAFVYWPFTRRSTATSILCYCYSVSSGSDSSFHQTGSTFFLFFFKLVLFYLPPVLRAFREVTLQ